ncbi:hypothetical protein [Streptomyces sp. NPDC005209]|uniref:hypothetical protein n=1 Tax=Streptomyces sp. NPDC005209 TaxID=3156715 RepID=UPI0033AF36E0
MAESVADPDPVALKMPNASPFGTAMLVASARTFESEDVGALQTNGVLDPGVVVLVKKTLTMSPGSTVTVLPLSAAVNLRI